VSSVSETDAPSAVGTPRASRADSQGAVTMHTIEKTVEVGVPVRTAYNQWTQFEEFPRFMRAVRDVQQLDDKRLHWRAVVLGQPLEWTAEITHQVPDRRICWRSTAGIANSGSVSFQPLSSARTRVTLRVLVHPESTAQSAGCTLGLVGALLRGDLARFRTFIEGRGWETGRWRGEIQGMVVIPATHARQGLARARSA